MRSLSVSCISHLDLELLSYASLLPVMHNVVNQLIQCAVHFSFSHGQYNIPAFGDALAEKLLQYQSRGCNS